MEENNLTNVDFSNQDLDTSTNLGETPIYGSMDSLFDELMRDDDTHACTHFHTCNPPGPESFPHTHTCVHVHRKRVPPDQSNTDNDGHNNEDFAESNGRKRGWEGGSNREAVRKYRQKKKAYTASLANELVSLRATNQQLVQRLQHQVTLQTEVARLKCLLVDIRGRIEGEIGSFPYQTTVVQTVDKQPNISNADFLSSCTIPCNVQCGDQNNLNCIASLESPSSFN